MAVSAADVMAELRSVADPEKAAIFARYHKAERPYLGIAYPAIDRIATTTARRLKPAKALALADDLWASDVFEARILAARICQRPVLKDRLADVWAMIVRWKEVFDSWAIADAVAKAGARCLRDNPARLDDLEAWTFHRNMWVRRAALVFTLDWAKQGHDPGRILGWLAEFVDDRDWFIQKAIGWWLRELSKHDPERVRAFLTRHGAGLISVARTEATKYLH
ncbi:MAG TPA: DNA alkylation repair protein [Hyphomicrobiales bacterium]|nr:DNA alkylation repair protein [Kaistiaceae bacterium]HQF29974.1 DNA alkylation repair protein [Hyphomicrobiales bacterium]